MWNVIQRVNNIPNSDVGDAIALQAAAKSRVAGSGLGVAGRLHQEIELAGDGQSLSGITSVLSERRNQFADE